MARTGSIVAPIVTALIAGNIAVIALPPYSHVYIYGKTCIVHGLINLPIAT